MYCRQYNGDIHLCQRKEHTYSTQEEKHIQGTNTRTYTQSDTEKWERVSIYAHAQHNMREMTRKKSLIPGLVCENILNTGVKPLVIASNGSVHLEQHIGTVAWMIKESIESAIPVSFLMENILSHIPYVVELE